MARPRLDVVCFGEILWDIFETSQSRAAAGFDRQLGGAPANVATGLARLGVQSAVVGGVGIDRFGDALIEHLEADGVDTSYVLRFPKRTGVTFVFRDSKGEPSFLFYRHESADLAVEARHITRAMADATWVLVGTSTLMTPTLAKSTYAFLDHADRAGAHVFVDLNVRPHLWSDRNVMKREIAKLVRRAALVKASDADLVHVAGKKGIAWLEQNAGEASWLITRGAGRASAIGAHGDVEMDANTTRCVDATGAGDAFIAGALSVLVANRATPISRKWSSAELWRHVLRVGNAMGARAVGRVGAVAGLNKLERLKKSLKLSQR